MKQHRHGRLVPWTGIQAFDPSQGMEWREIMSWYPIDGGTLGRICFAKGTAQQEPLGMGNDDWARWLWDPGGSIDGKLSQRLVLDPGIKGSIQVC